MATATTVKSPTEVSNDDSEDLPEPLIRFTETFNFKKFVEKHVIPSEDGDIADIVRSSARLLGQTRNGEFLFAWDRKNDEDEIITAVGMFYNQMTSHQMIYQHESRVNLCNASVNNNKTLLAFTYKETAYEEGESLYDSYIAEIQPQSRLFNLNIRSPNFRILQFLSVENQMPKNRLSSKATQMSHLLVVIPQVIICLYHFKIQLIALGAVVLDHPKQEVIQKNFSWYQWDPHTQWLYYARFETSATKASMSGKNSLLLSCENFSTPNHQLIFTVSLPLPYNGNLYTEEETFFDNPLAFTLPIREMNLQILYRRDGFWCACLQHCTEDVLGQENASSQGVKIDYSVYIIHNGYVLNGQVPLLQVPPEGVHIHFMLVHCFVVAYIPDVMLHLLNIGPRVDPCHHLTFGSDYSAFAITGSAPPPPTGSLDELSSNDSSVFDTLLSLASAVSGSLIGDYETAVIDCNTCNVYDCNLNIPSFFSLFKKTNDAVLKEDLIHLMVVGFRHHGLALSMIEHICQTPMTMSDHRLFAEFIVASSFANVYFDCKKFFARQLPLTTTPTYHGKVCKNRDGGNLALLKLSRIPNFIKQLLVQSDQQLVMATPEDLLNYDPPGNQAFENLCFNAVLSQPDYPRMDLKKLPEVDESRHLGDPSPGSSRQQRGSKKGIHSGTIASGGGGILNKIATFGRKSGNYTSPARSAGDPQDKLTFLTCDKDIADKLTNEASAMREKLTLALTKDLPLRAKNIAFNTVATYYSELEKQSCNLMLVIWQSLGFGIEDYPLNGTLCRPPTTKECILFELLEAYQLAHLDLGLPLPMGFQTLFVSVGYLTLEKVLFLQYLRNEVFTPTKRFVEMLVEDSEDEDSQVLFQVFCNLDYALSEFAFSNWHDPTVRQLEQTQTEKK